MSSLFRETLERTVSERLNEFCHLETMEEPWRNPEGVLIHTVQVDTVPETERCTV